MLMEGIQIIGTGSAVVLGIIYIIGGLIVNLNLTRRGVVEYQILKVKYLAVGIIFSLQLIGVFIFAGLPAFGLLIFTNNIQLLEFINLLSILTSLALLLTWSRYPSNTKSFFGSYKFWFIASSIGALFPMLIFLRQMLAPNFGDWLWIIFTAQAVLTASLTIISMIFHYSAFYYGCPNLVGELDPIGIGIPSRVRLAYEVDKHALLTSLGMPIYTDNISDDIYLLDETANHYIICYQLVGGDSAEETVKIDKDLIKAIIYRPEHRYQAEGGDARYSHRKKKEPDPDPKHGSRNS